MEFYKFAKAPDKNDKYYKAYLVKYAEYYKEQTSPMYNNDPGDVLGYVYSVGNIAVTFNISKRAARRLISRWCKEGVLKEWKGR